MNGRRLLCVYQHAPTPGAPGIYRHRQYLAALAQHGWKVDMVSTPRNYMSGQVPDRYKHRPVVQEVIDGVQHHWVWTPGGIHRSRFARVANYGAFAAAAASCALTLPRPDVILVSSPPLTVAPLGPLLARRFRCPWLLEVRDIWPESAVSVGWLRRDSVSYRVLDRLARGVTSRAARVIVPTPGLEPLVRAHGATEVTTLTGIVSPRPRDDARRAGCRAQLGLLADECLFLYLGAIGVANGLEELLDAVKLLQPDSRARVVIAGDGSARRSVEAMISAQRLSRVTLLPPVARDEADGLLAAADVGLHLLRRDPVFESALPTKVLEYLSARLPFITTVSGLPAQIATEIGGSAVTSATELANEIERWSAMEPEERQTAGDRALQYGLDRFGLAASVERLEALLDDVVVA